MYAINKKSDFHSLFMIRGKIENVKTKGYIIILYNVYTPALSELDNPRDGLYSRFICNILLFVCVYVLVCVFFLCVYLPVGMGLQT